MTTYFGFALADSMFPAACRVERVPMTVDEVRALLPGTVSCLNPAHRSTIDAAMRRFGLALTIPATAANVQLAPGDRILVMSVRGLPRRGERPDFTDEEIAKAEFAFGLWTVL